MKDNKTLLDVAHALMLLVEGPGCARWEDGHGFRLKDMPEWAAFYCAVKACAFERDTVAAERDALAAEVGALTSARDAYRTMLWQAEEDVKALREDAERWREVERRFNGSKTSAASMALEGLGLEPTPYRDFAETVDVARAEPGT